MKRPYRAPTLCLCGAPAAPGPERPYRHLEGGCARCLRLEAAGYSEKPPRPAPQEPRALYELITARCNTWLRRRGIPATVATTHITTL